MILPIGTDAPIYHRPIATVGLIVANVIAFGYSMTNFEEADWLRWMLLTGDGLRPLQWVTHGFLHADIFHLAGNMVFLWAFGLIVEGKLGALAFLGLYLGLDVLCGLAIQLVFLGAEPGLMLGASGVVYGLLGTAMIWAPRNELTCAYFFVAFIRVFSGIWEVPIVVFAGLYLGMELLAAGWEGFGLSSAFAHMTGAIWGLLLGSALVKLDLVDCEGWDAFSLLANRKRGAGRRDGRRWRDAPRASGPSGGRTRRERPEAAGPLPDEARVADARRRVGHMLDQGMATAALQAHDKASRTLPNYRLEEAEHLRLIRGLLDAGAAAEAIGPMRSFIEHYPKRAHRVRLRLAQVLLDAQRPQAAARVLVSIPAGGLPEDLEALRRQLMDRARAMQDEGVLEVEGDL